MGDYRTISTGGITVLTVIWEASFRITVDPRDVSEPFAHFEGNSYAPMKHPFLFYEISRRCRQERVFKDVEMQDTVELRAIVAEITSAIDAGIRTLVLGAIGCGVFLNDPRSVAEMYKSVPASIVITSI